MKITWLSHAAFLIEGNDRVLIDPFLTNNPLAQVGPDDVECDIIAVTHGHGDHLGDAIAIAKRTGAAFVAMAEVATYASGKGLEPVGMNFGGTVEVKGTRITQVPAWHSAGISEANFGHSGGTACGYIVDSGMKVYHAGDTCLFSDMKLTGELYSPDIFLVPIGDRFTMDPRTAAMAVEWVKPRVAIPMHFNTWPPIEQDPGTFADEVEKRCDTEVRILAVGETAEF